MVDGQLLYNTRSSTSYSVTTDRGGVGWGLQGGLRGGYICILMADSLYGRNKQHCKAIILQLKINFFKKSLSLQKSSRAQQNQDRKPSLPAMSLQVSSTDKP